jgi:hypothetical protein
MQFSKVASLVALAGLSHSFLIPSTMSVPDAKVVDAIPFEAQAAAQRSEVFLNCPGCRVVLSTNDVVAHSANKLKFVVEVKKDDSGADALLINDVSVLNMHASADAQPRQGMHADQLMRDPKHEWVVASNPEIGYYLRTTSIHDNSKYQDMTAYHVEMRVAQVAGDMVDWTAIVDVVVIKDQQDDKLMIAKSRVLGPFHRPKVDYVAVVSPPECNSVLCRWRVTFFKKVDSFRKDCGRKAGSFKHPRPNGIFKGPHGRPRPAGFEHARPSHRHGHRHGSQLTVARVINDIFNFIVIPMVIGAALGIFASIVGAIVGHFIVFVWRVLFRRGERGQCSRRQNLPQTGDDLNADHEKTGLMEDQEAPPVYEDAVVDDKNDQK